MNKILKFLFLPLFPFLFTSVPLFSASASHIQDDLLEEFIDQYWVPYCTWATDGEDDWDVEECMYDVNESRWCLFAEIEETYSQGGFEELLSQIKESNRTYPFADWPKVVEDRHNEFLSEKNEKYLLYSIYCVWS